MQEKRSIWERSFESFAGPGIHRPSDMMRVGESEALALRADLAALQWQAPAYAGTGRHAGYSVCNAVGAWATGLFFFGDLVGFYAGSSLWISRSHRGLGLSTPLILTATEHRGGTILPPGVVVQGYTRGGLAAHRAAHAHAVLTAAAEGLPVPAAVLRELQREGQELPATAGQGDGTVDA